ncbi:MAG: hypothetical protein JNJ91_03170, partial [Flavobacteriales bacterium]|nr:hypothetical protein [Flavobacteriales bacterium]
MHGRSSSKPFSTPHRGGLDHLTFTPRDHHAHSGADRSVMTGSTKYIFVTGGVTSSLGKGIISAS